MWTTELKRSIKIKSQIELGPKDLCFYAKLKKQLQNLVLNFYFYPSNNFEITHEILLE